MEAGEFFQLFAALSAALIGFLGYLTALPIYRLICSPLKDVPGPRIAAATAWYEFYWDCIKHGQYVFKIQEMHKQYGPIVRINPWEVHIDDPDFFDEFYSMNKLDKDAWFYRCMGNNYGLVTTPFWELHRARRGAMAKFFSSANVAKLEGRVLSRVQLLLNRIDEHRQSGSVIDISNAYRCYATDIISDYAAPHTRDFLNTPDFSATFNRVLRDFSSFLAWHRHIPIVFPLLNSIPKFIATWMDSTGGTRAVIENQEDLLRQAKTVIQNKGIPSEKESPTVLDAIYTSTLLGSEEKTLTRLMAEAQNIIGAGTETTGNTLSNFTYHVISQPRVLEKLRNELREAASQTASSSLMDYRTLERLPYLKACIKEALRLATGVSSRLPRLSRTDSITYRSPSGQVYRFASNTVISMSILDLHYNEDVFINAKAFKPERWLENNKEKLQQMEKAFAPFGRGPRQCVGLELAKEEITLMTGNLFHQYDLKLYETTEEDVKICYDFFAPWGPDDSKGVRVIAK